MPEGESLVVRHGISSQASLLTMAIVMACVFVPASASAAGLGDVVDGATETTAEAVPVTPPMAVPQAPSGGSDPAAGSSEAPAPVAVSEATPAAQQATPAVQPATSTVQREAAAVETTVQREATETTATVERSAQRLRSRVQQDGIETARDGVEDTGAVVDEAGDDLRDGVENTGTEVVDAVEPVLPSEAPLPPAARDEDGAAADVLRAEGDRAQRTSTPDRPPVDEAEAAQRAAAQPSANAGGEPGAPAALQVHSTPNGAPEALPTSHLSDPSPGHEGAAAIASATTQLDAASDRSDLASVSAALDDAPWWSKLAPAALASGSGVLAGGTASSDEDRPADSHASSSRDDGGLPSGGASSTASASGAGGSSAPSFAALSSFSPAAALTSARRLLSGPADWRPVPFVSLLERPG